MWILGLKGLIKRGNTKVNMLGGEFIRQEMFTYLTVGVTSFKVITTTLNVVFYSYNMEHELSREFQAFDIKYKGM